MVKFNGLIAAATFALSLPMAASAQQLDFVKTYSLPSNTSIQDLHIDGDDIYVVWDTNYAILEEIGVAAQKLAIDGDEQWRYMLASYYSDWSEPTELEFARDTAANQHGFYFIHDDSYGKSIVATSPEGENLWSVAAHNSGWFSEDFPKTNFTELYAADDILYVSGSITETQGGEAVTYLFAYDKSGDEISREQDAGGAKYNAEKFAGSVNYNVDYDTNTITVLANDGSVSDVIESNDPIQSVAYSNGYFYVTQSTSIVNEGGYRLVQYSLDGTSSVLNSFSPKIAKTDASTTSVKVDEQGIYTFGYQFSAECCDSEKLYRLAQYDFDGELTSAKYYPDIPQSFPWTLLAIEQGSAYLQIGEAVSDDVYETNSNYIAKIDLSDSAYFALPELSIHAMEQLPVSGELGLAVVSQGVAENTLIQEAVSGASQSTIALDLEPQVGRQIHVDSVLYPNANGGVQLATLMQSKTDPNAYGQPVQAELKTAVALSQSDNINVFADGKDSINFNSDNAIATPLDLIVIPDQNGNGTYELGVLSELPNKGGVFLEVRDPNGNTDKPMFRVSFNPNFSPKDVALVQDLDGDDRPEIALLSVNDAKGQSKVEIRSLDGKLVKNLWPGKNYVAEFFVESQLDDNYAPVPASELAVVQVKTEGGVRVVTLDVATGKPIKYKGLNPSFIPVKAVAMPDINNNGASEYAVLSQSRATVDGVEQLKARIDIVDTGSNKTINKIWHRKDATVYDLAVMPDQNGNQTVELATAIWQDGGLKLRIQDSLTDALINTQSLKVVH